MGSFITLTGIDGLLRAVRKEDICRLDDEINDTDIYVCVTLRDGTQINAKSSVEKLLPLIDAPEL